uniref:Uncharacterized protein n=1 Tax=Parascaris univalens TaxID=6257 RepID=A0A914ZMC6_PARUN
TLVMWWRQWSEVIYGKDCYEIPEKLNLSGFRFRNSGVYVSHEPLSAALCFRITGWDLSRVFLSVLGSCSTLSLTRYWLGFPYSMFNESSRGSPFLHCYK